MMVLEVQCFTFFLSRGEARLLDEVLSPLVDSLIKHNPATGHLRRLVRLLLALMADLKDEAKCQR